MRVLVTLVLFTVIVCDLGVHCLYLLEVCTLRDYILAPDLFLGCGFTVCPQLEVRSLLRLVFVTGIVITFINYWLSP